MELVTHTDFYRIDNSNEMQPRYIIHWLAFARFKTLKVKSYEDALRIAKKIGGKRFHNKKFGGGIAFYSWEISNLVFKINSIEIIY
jgi:hypothetical protein